MCYLRKNGNFENTARCIIEDLVEYGGWRITRGRHISQLRILWGSGITEPYNCMIYPGKSVYIISVKLSWISFVVLQNITHRAESRLYSFVNKTKLGQDNGLWHFRRQAMNWTSTGLSLIGSNFQSNFNQNSTMFLPLIVFGNVTSKMSAILSRPQLMIFIIIIIVLWFLFLILSLFKQGDIQTHYINV